MSKKLPTRKRTKKFTGCWTCRKRRVSCDETRPVCENCKSTGVECGGYVIKLCWQRDSKDSSIASFDGTRSAILYRWKEEDLLSRIEVDYYLERIETVSLYKEVKNSKPEDGYGCGPFSVFRAGKDYQAIQPEKSPDRISEIEANPSFDEGHSFPQVVDEDLAAYYPTPLTPLKSRFDIEQKLQDISFSGLNGSLKTETLLLEFWDLYLSKLMTPVDDSNETNPYQLILNTALTDPISLEIQKAVIHSTCATCSTFLSICRDRTDVPQEYRDLKFDDYWKFHKMQALDFVSAAYPLKEILSSQDLGLLMASMFFLLTIDIFHNSSEWQIHFRGAVSTLKSMKAFENFSIESYLDYDTDLSHAIVFFAQLTKLTYLFSTLYLSDEDVFNKYMSVLEFESICILEDDDSNSLLYKYEGVTNGLLKSLTDVIKYLQFRDSHETEVKSISEIEKDLIKCKPVFKSLDDDPVNSKILHYQSTIFYVAVKLVFLREIKNERLSDLQELVNVGIDHVELNDQISQSSKGSGLFWPYFVICCEANTVEGQSRLKKWLETVNPFVPSMKRGSRVIYAVWDRRSKGEDVSWITVIRDTDPTLLLF
ncbi:unnamed protein product [Kuraishia capsulata CBS 1993]|uniref:Zn(2)-C6 fungal-type domain-containing protein n=1 Tax=Kuraishia capsulata CBS 1993 TaxID=1382522 RepID=W6MFF6_9ASCO|nr:uncharacterized protein KUCA_T00000013001 [Kuraishia capsulata CBS 1993]CDK24053.1 unnamed protein product [Kuraishia capsulata CBS 1993]